MTGAAIRAVAQTLTARVAAIEGVRGVFPQHAIGAALLAAVRSPSTTAGPLVHVDDAGPAGLRVTARLATTRTVPTPVVIEHVADAVADLLGDQPYALHVEVAFID